MACPLNSGWHKNCREGFHVLCVEKSPPVQPPCECRCHKYLGTMEKPVEMCDYEMYAVVHNGLRILGKGEAHPHIFWERKDAEEWLKKARGIVGDSLVDWEIKKIRFTVC